MYPPSIGTPQPQNLFRMPVAKLEADHNRMVYYAHQVGVAAADGKELAANDHCKRCRQGINPLEAELACKNALH